MSTQDPTTNSATGAPQPPPAEQGEFQSFYSILRINSFTSESLQTLARALGQSQSSLPVGQLRSTVHRLVQEAETLPDPGPLQLDVEAAYTKNGWAAVNPKPGRKKYFFGF